MKARTARHRQREAWYRWSRRPGRRHDVVRALRDFNGSVALTFMISGDAIMWGRHLEIRRRGKHPNPGRGRKHGQELISP